MPFEPRIRTALDALAAPRQAFRSAVAITVDEVGAYLDAHRAPGNGRERRTADELGPFAEGRLDAARFAATLGESGGVADPLAVARIERAYDTLRHLDARGDAAFVVRVKAGGDLRAHVGRALAEIGRVFHAARAVEMARTGRYSAEQFDECDGGFAFRDWNRAERQIAPPLIVEVEGGDLQVGGLAEFMAGRQKIVLIVNGPAPIAPLVRLVSPRVFVAQVAEGTDLAEFVGADGPGVVALVPEGSAQFVHRPGDAPAWERLAVRLLPEGEDLGALGSFTAFQQTEEVSLLQALAAAPRAVLRGPAASEPGGEDAEAPSGTIDPADRVAAWLLGQSGFTAPVPAPAPAAAAPEPADALAAWLLSRTDLSGT